MLAGSASAPAVAGAPGVRPKAQLYPPGQDRLNQPGVNKRDGAGRPSVTLAAAV